MRDTEDFYRVDAEFARWAQREGLEPGEQFMLTRYLDPSKKTLEAGAAGGRLLLAMQADGFNDLAGYDILPEFIEAARQRDKTGTIDYSVQDGRKLSYPDNSFDQLVYLQQFFSVVGDKADRANAAAEAFRVLRPGGRMVVSVLSMRGRSKTLAPLFAWLWLLRTVTFRSRSLQNQPWLRSGDSPNYAALLDRGPYTYWYYEQETIDFLRATGFVVEAVGSDAQVRAGEFFDPNQLPPNAPFAGRFYLVCNKPK